MKRFLILMLIPLLLMSSCSMEAAIPENDRTFSNYTEHRAIYHKAVEYLSELEFDAMVSRNDFYSVEGSEAFDGLYLQNMQDLSIISCDDVTLSTLFEQTDVKLVDWIRRENLQICAFDMCIPGKNFDYGVYYTSGEDPVYFGDPSLELQPSGNGFSYEKKASYGAKFTYYTEKIEDHFYYYEIS